VQIEPAALPWRLLALAWFDDAEAALAARHALRASFGRFAHASCVPFGRERHGLLFRAAAAEPAPPDTAAHIAHLFGLDTPETLHYQDARRGQRRSLRVQVHDGQGVLTALLLAGDTRAESWLVPLLQQQAEVPAAGRLLAAGAQPPGPAPMRQTQICSCFDVSQQRIEQALQRCEGSATERLATLQQQLRCGTQCGSCLPTLKRLVQQVPTTGVPA
jgi:assimilatory nitrate reductase catalytic subunit